MTCTNTYVTTGTNNEMVLSTYFLSTSSPNVILGGDDGYEAQHNRGTAAAGKVLLYEAGADAAALDEFANAGDASGVILTFIALGQTP
jgi:hypothetical protein